ncbi:toxin [Ottowia testudinis]|uniref:Toxin n=1 Tax=Ottowia testudinis TaxID=2816950 RepID=A0A975CFN2_9BURK|nr:toxin [Ottowia testudinis]QTD45530.1 toxin [Ottowia testudinis]
MNDSGQRFVVIGTSGAGKSRLASELARVLGLPHIELDALHWRPGWTPSPPADFEAGVRRATAGPRWVVDGNYSAVRHIVWPRATHIVWLDYGRATVMARVWRRTLWRALTREPLWSGNRELLRRSFASRDSVLLWSWNTFDKNRAAYAALQARGAYPAQWVRLTSPAQARAWLRGLAAQSACG